MIPKRYESALFSLILSAMMFCLVSGISTFRITGMAKPFFGMWAGAWVASWLVAFPAVMLAAPLTRSIVRRLVARE